MLTIIVISSTSTFAQAKSSDGTYTSESKIDSIVTNITTGCEAIVKLGDYHKVGMDTIYSFPDGGLQMFEFTKGRKEFHGTFGLDKFIINNGSIVYYVGGKKFSITGKTFVSEGNFDQEFAKAKLLRLHQNIQPAVRKK